MPKVLGRGDLLEVMEEVHYRTELELQELLMDHPELLSIDGANDRWLLVTRSRGLFPRSMVVPYGVSTTSSSTASAL